jgi:hypothetical protein
MMATNPTATQIVMPQPKPNWSNESFNSQRKPAITAIKVAEQTIIRSIEGVR